MKKRGAEMGGGGSEKRRRGIMDSKVVGIERRLK